MREEYQELDTSWGFRNRSPLSRTRYLSGEHGQQHWGREPAWDFASSTACSSRHRVL